MKRKIIITIGIFIFIIMMILFFIMSGPDPSQQANYHISLMDKNNDFLVSFDEWMDFQKQIFIALDKDKNKSLSKQEFMNLMRVFFEMGMKKKK